MALHSIFRTAPAALTGLALAGLTLTTGLATAQAAGITGAGATFPAPVYAKWAEAYRAETGNTLNYQAIGSGGGIRQIKGKTVDVVVPATFAAQGKTGVFEGRLTMRRGDFSIGDGAWKAFDVVANDVVIRFRITAAAR